MAYDGIEKALTLLKNLPRVVMGNIKQLPLKKFRKKQRRGQHAGKDCGRSHRGMKRLNKLPPLGYEGGQTPLVIKVPSEPYYHGFHLRRQYPPLTLHELQRMIDLGWVDPKEPIDLTSLCNAKTYRIDTERNHYGVNLTDEGADIFVARVNLEVQWTSEAAIAAVERNGGTILTRYLDKLSVEAMKDPAAFFRRGLPIPRCKLPPEDVLDYYSDPRNRGYLADPQKIRLARVELAQKYGYKLKEWGIGEEEEDALLEMLRRRKDPRQIWFGLQPGWVVNVKDKVVLKPKDERLKAYYSN